MHHFVRVGERVETETNRRTDGQTERLREREKACARDTTESQLKNFVIFPSTENRASRALHSYPMTNAGTFSVCVTFYIDSICPLYHLTLPTTKK